MTSTALLNAVVYDDDSASRLAAAAIVEQSAVEVVDVASGVSGVSELIDHVRSLRPDLIVLELALAGTRGLGIVPALVATVPGTAVVLLSPFGGLRDAALRAGAYDLVDGNDLRQLRRTVRRLVTERLARKAQQEPAVAVEQVATMGAGEGTGDRQAEPGTAAPVEAYGPFGVGVGTVT